MKLEKLVLSNGYVAYPDSVDHILKITGVRSEKCFGGSEGFSFLISWNSAHNTSDKEYVFFKSKRSCSYNRNKLLRWIDEVKRINAEDIERIECEAAHRRIE